MGSGGLAPTNCFGGTPHVRDPASAARRGRGPRGERHAARHQATDILRGNGFRGRLFPKAKLHGVFSVVFPQFTSRSQLACLDEIDRLRDVAKTHGRTDGVPAQRPPSGVHTVCIQRITLLQLAHSQPLSPSRDILLCRWCLRALALRHERQVLMCQCRHAPPASRHPRVLYLTCVFACLEGTRSTTGHDSRCASTASTPSTGLGDSTTSVVVRSS